VNRLSGIEIAVARSIKSDQRIKVPPLLYDNAVKDFDARKLRVSRVLAVAGFARIQSVVGINV